MTDVELPPASFDTVVMIETVEHLLDPAQTLRMAYNLLRPGGALLLAVPNLNSVMRPLLGVAWSVLSPAEHLYYFTETTLNQLLWQIGFSETRFVWYLPHQARLETMNPYNTHEPYSWRSRVVRWGILGLGRFWEPLVIKTKHSDRLIALAVK